MSLLLLLDDDILSSIANAGEPVIDREALKAVVSLSSTCSSVRARLAPTVEDIRSRLPPPYSAQALDAALAAGNEEVARPLLVEAMKRLGRNLEKIIGRLQDRGYPVASSCQLCGHRYLARFDAGFDEHVAALHERGFKIPLVLEVLWRELGGFALAVPSQPVAESIWWMANAPEIQNVGEGVVPGPDPAWMDHGAAVLRQFEDESTPMSLPVGFNEEEGFVFREGHVLHLSPDCFSKRLPQTLAANPSSQNPNAAHNAVLQPPGSYAVWLEAEPALDPELLRFTPPAEETLGGAEPLWRPQCSLLRYLRIAILEGGGFPGFLGLAEYEPLRAELAEGLLEF